MSREKLTEALLEKKDERARALWQEMEQKANRYREEAEERCSEKRRAAERRHQATLTQQRDLLESRIGKRLRRVRLLAEETFSVQLRQLALEQLTLLVKQHRSNSLQQLAAELPERDWQKITVHPEDQIQVAQLFPGCAIMTDPALLGGMIASVDDEAICVDNSLVKRLDQVWPELCGGLLDALQGTEGTGDEDIVA